MVKFYGQIASVGFETGILVVKNTKNSVSILKFEGVEEELHIFDKACKKATLQYEQMIEDARISFGNVAAMMLRAHQQLIQDQGFHIGIRDIIQSENCFVHEAIGKVAKTVITPMLENTDEYLKSRAKDILYVADWLSNCCFEIREQASSWYEDVWQLGKEDMILIGEDFGFEDVIIAKRNSLVGMIDIKGSMDSHTGMLARELRLPLLVQVKGEIKMFLGRLARLDANKGCVEVE
jgi:phosphoenolpyruvate-protein kinase (PTS system EI component)